MKTKITLLILAFFSIIQLNAQVKIGDNPTVIDSSAILELKSSSKGLLIPRMTQAERNSIVVPATGLMIYQTDNSVGFYYFNGSSWIVVGGGIATETDPVFNASVASGITLSNTTNWNTAYSWGNHSGLYRPLSWVPAWTDITGKPNPYIAGNGISLSGDTLHNTLPNLNHTGDAVGSSALTVVKLQGRDVSNTSPTSGQVLKWNGLSWVPDVDNNTTMPTGSSNATLRNNGNTWVTSTLLYNTDSRIGIGIAAPNQQLEITQNFRLPVSTATVGNIYKDANLFIHNKGTDNVFIGVNSGNLTATGNNNTALGAYSLYSNTSGNALTAVGNNALRSNTSGIQNTAIGYWSMYSNSTGSYNTALGYRSLNGNTSGFENTAIGYQSMLNTNTGYANTALGYQSLYSNTVGIDNTAVGDYALRSNISGNDNTATGFFALNLNTSGSNNTANGTLALKSNTTGVNNTALGYNAGFLNATGSGNVFIGNQAGYNETGSNKLIINNSQSLTPLISGDFSTKNVSINTLTPHGSAVFEVSSTSKGVLLPRLTQEQIIAISAPDTGLIVFNNTSKVYLIYTGSQWRELTMGGCIPSPSPAIAGNNQTVCNYPITLNATSPAVGTGKWTIESGLGGVIADSLNPQSSFTGSQGVEYTLKWTVSTSCSNNAATIKVLKPASLTVDAGNTLLNSCADEIQLNASSVPNGYTGTWSIISGSGGSLFQSHDSLIILPGLFNFSQITFIDSSESVLHNPVIKFKGLKETIYKLKWTISNSCITAYDSVSISFAGQTIANAGSDVSVTSLFVFAVTLSGNMPSANETGTWSIQKGISGSLNDIHNPNTLFNVVHNRQYVLSWTISGLCKTTSSNVNITTGPLTSAVQYNGNTYYVYPYADNAESIVWGGDSIIGASSDTNGLNNTNLIVSALGNNNGIPYAAKVCYDLAVGGYDDWYLPSIVELKEIVLNHANDISSFSDNSVYLSSTEYSYYNAIRTYISNSDESVNSYNYLEYNYSKLDTKSYIRNKSGGTYPTIMGETCYLCLRTPVTYNNDINGYNRVRCIRKQ
ncbi:MAG: hypothetical protein ACOYO1_15035 [Bacteroidales bacterium]